MDVCSTMNAVQHVATESIEGDFVECGVWAGGNSIAAKKIFQMYNCNKKFIVLIRLGEWLSPLN